jgi:thiamine kinase-like enzyme
VTQAGTVKPVDWEMAGVGPALVDVAALTAGWGTSERERLIAAYERAGPPATVDRADLDRCRLHLSLQWIGWAPDWQAPPAHAHDWVDEALAVAGRLDLR